MSDPALTSSEAGLMSGDQALLVARYFLATYLEEGEEIVFHDALIDETMRTTDYHPLLSRLYLFGLILDMGGRRKLSINETPAGAQNAFVREHLYDGGWLVQRLDKQAHMRPFLQQNLRATLGTITKFMTNLFYFFAQCGFVTDENGYLKTFAEHWAPIAIKTFFQRYELTNGKKDVTELISAADNYELYKLLGVQQEWSSTIIAGAADAYYAGRDALFFPAMEEEEDREPTSPMRETRQVATFRRIKENRDRLEEWYGGRRQLCNEHLGSRHGAIFDAAHIQPLAHGGPDTVDNMLSLCPNHHRQIDLGAIGIDPDTHAILAPIETAPSSLTTLVVRSEHHLRRAYIEYHHQNVFGRDY